MAFSPPRLPLRPLPRTVPASIGSSTPSLLAPFPFTARRSGAQGIIPERNIDGNVLIGKGYRQLFEGQDARDRRVCWWPRFVAFQPEAGTSITRAGADALLGRSWQMLTCHVAQIPGEKIG